MTQFCRDCGHHRPVSDSTSNNRSRDGLAFYCREHMALRSARSREARCVKPRVHRFTPPGTDVPDGHKWCPDCGAVKQLSEFPRTRAAASGRGSYCLPCHNARGKASRESLGGSRTYHLTRRYGITAEEADAMLAEQDGLCAICRTAHVDHDHATGKVRELLCFNCNGGLGQFRDDPEVLRLAADYVERHATSVADDSVPGRAEQRGHGAVFSRFLAMRAADEHRVARGSMTGSDPAAWLAARR